MPSLAMEGLTVSLVPTLETTLNVLSPMTLNLKGDSEEMVTLPTMLPVRNAKMAVSPVPSRSTTLELLSQMTLNLEGKEMPAHATTLEGSDSNAAAYPITMNSLKLTNPTTNVGQDSQKTSTRPARTNAAGMLSRLGMIAEMPTYPMLPPSPTRATSSAHPLLRPSHRYVPHVSPALL